MEINNAATAAEFCGAWLRETTPGRAEKRIASCLASQRGNLVYDLGHGRHNTAKQTQAAIDVLEAGLAEAQRLNRR